MTDIVERLNEEAANKSQASFNNGCVSCGVASNMLEEAAAEFERLRAAHDDIVQKLNLHIVIADERLAEIERLRAALNGIVERYETRNKFDGSPSVANEMAAIARAALEVKS